LTNSDRDIADLAYSGLLDIHKEKLDGQDLLDVSRLLQKALANENRLRESKNSQKTNEKSNHPIYYASDYSDNESKDVYAAEFTWSSDDKPNTCVSLKPAHKSRQDEIKFTFDVAKCDRIFDELLKLGKIKISHTLPPPDEIKKCAYCKFHHSYSHTTNDCNSFRRQIQSAINEGRLVLHTMQVDQNPFPVNAFMNILELLNPKVLIRSDQTDKAKGKNIIIREQRPDEKLSLEETPKIAVKASMLGGQGVGDSHKGPLNNQGKPTYLRKNKCKRT
jgi:hypothetical protein